jgi:predicted transposase YbfD/YdcC
MQGFISIFSGLPDPRAANARHELLEVLYVAFAAVLCGAENCADMAEFGEAKEDLLREVLRLEHGIPSHDTFSRLFRLLDPEAFEAAFREFMVAFARGLSGVVAIDGKSLRGAFERGKRSTPLHLVNVWAADQRLAIAQRKAPGRNEIAGAVEVIGLLSLKGCIVTADALHCNAKVARAVLDRGGEYALVLKENQGPLYADAVRLLDAAASQDEGAEQRNRSHDRIEQRRAIVLPDTTLAERHGFPGLRAIGRIEALRRIEGKPEERLVRHFVLSQPLPPDKLLHTARIHWGIENELHWVLDVVLDEDRARNRKDHGPQNLALLRKLALNMLRAHPDKASLRRKIKRAGWDNQFLISLLGQMR